MPTTPRPTETPALTPQFCVNTTALRDFLRLSRSTVDDSISTHLNSMITPARTNPFLPSMLGGGQRTSEPPPRGSRRNVPSEACERLKEDTLFPAWRERDRVMRYCDSVATAPNASQVSQASDAGAGEGAQGHRDFWGRLQTTDERLDPYSGREYGYNRESAIEQLATVLKNEEYVERIVRGRTWAVLDERCTGARDPIEGHTIDRGWQENYQQWSTREAG